MVQLKVIHQDPRPNDIYEMTLVMCYEHFFW